MNFIESTFPIHLSDNVAVNQEIDIFFFIDIDKHTITPDRVILFNINEERSESIEFTYKNRRLIIRPQRYMSPNSHYQVQLIGGKNGIKDIVGRTMPQSYKIEFYTKKTQGIVPPKIIAPTHLTETEEDVTFQWTPVPGADHYELEVSKTNVFQNLIWPPAPVKVYDTKIKPHINYEKGLYYMRIRSVDGENNKSHYSDIIQFYYQGLSQYQASIVKNIDPPEGFIIETNGRTINQANPLQTLQNFFQDEKRPENGSSFVLTKSKPKHKRSNVKNIASEIVIEFSADIDENSIDEESVYVIAERN